MRSVFRCAGLLALIVFHGAKAESRFELASVKRVPMVAEGQTTGPESIVVHPGSLAMRNVRLRSCIKWAYDLKEYQVSGPSWLGSPGWLGRDVARYEIVAKAAENTPVPELRAMLRTLLAERFGFSAHQETREAPAYILSVGKIGPRLRASDDQGGEKKLASDRSAVTFQSTTIAEFAEWISGPLGAPVLDETNFSGRFDFKVDAARFSREKEDQQYVIVNAIQDQLGLKLERRKSPIEMLVVDRLEQVPTEN
jgi:uncharacterized protein (TIGR03435 family)